MQLFRTKSVEQTIAETGEEGRKLKRNLTWWDLSIMGVAVAVGAGIFSVGAQAAAFHAGPAVIISFLIAGIVCGAAVMCYAEFASMIPVAGSAYTFTYTTVGEIMAWIIGWDLILEMLMAGSVISKYWGVYLNDFMRLMGWNANTNLTFGSFHIDIAPIIIVAFFTTLLVFGTKIGARVDGAMTVLKIAIVFFVVIVGFFYVKASNFTPFIPPSQPASTVEGSSAVTGVMTQPLWQFATGMTPSVYGVPGILSGAALVFFAFIGFDVVATASEETKNPHKNVPLGIGVGMLLIIVMYMLVAVVTTGAGNPSRYMPMWLEAGIKVIPVVASVGMAKLVTKAGAAAIIAEGGESGGHVGDLTTMVLVPQVCDATPLPVLAAGGIGDGRGVAAAFMLGAQGVQVGTRFLVAEECGVHPNYKKKVLKANDIATMVTGKRLGHPVRQIKNQFAKDYAKAEYSQISDEELEKLGRGALYRAAVEGDEKTGDFLAGQISGMINKEQPAAEIIQEMFQEAEEVLKGAGKWVR